jgi:tetratricopeptide (TPR) repeat protein
MLRCGRIPITAAALVLALACSSAPDQQGQSGGEGHGGQGAKPGGERTTLLGNLGSFGRPITTSNAEAQRFFDEGLTLLYGFNHEESFRSFSRAAALDDRAPMPHWGMALALGTNINDPAPADRLQRAHGHLAAAQARASNGSAVERALIDALGKRYVADPVGDQAGREQAYSDAMAEAAKAFPDDPDVSTLYAESLMNLRPWRLYDAESNPAPGTDTIVATLERVMAAHPAHPGANHYYIHAVEASKAPGRATAQAERLETLVPGAGHLVHMPAHIYMRTGQYARAAKSNADAARVDEKYFDATGASGMYSVMYYGHNLQFESAAAMFAGNFSGARDAARRTVGLVAPIADESPMLEPYALQESYVLLRFGRWNDASSVEAPPARRVVQTGLSHYVRGAALAALGRADEAAREHAALVAARHEVAPDLMISASNTGRSVLDVAVEDLAGRMAQARDDRAGALASYRKAVEAEDRLGYNEPPDWLLPVRERLGALLLAAGRHAEAERVFRADLGKNVGNPRSLYGLALSLEAQKKPEAAKVRTSFDEAWRTADVSLDRDLLGTK